MAIRKITSKKKKQGWRYDSATGEFYSYRADFRINGKRIREKGFPTVKEAEKFLDSAKLNQKYRKRGLPARATFIPTLKQLFEVRLKQIHNRRESVCATRVFQYFLNLFEPNLKISEVRKSHFQLFINSRLADGVKAETVNREITFISTALRQANELFPEELEDYEPPHIARARVGRKKNHKRIITEPEKERIVCFLKREMDAGEKSDGYENRVRIAFIFEIGWLLGLRLGEILRLKKTDFNFSERRLRVVRWKTGNVSQIEFLPDFICQLIQSAGRKSNGDFIFSPDGSMPSGFYPILKKACSFAGLEYGRGKLDGVTFHSTRHSFVTRLIQVTDLATTQSYTGHSNAEMVVYYSHASDSSRRKAMERLYADEQNFETIG